MEHKGRSILLFLVEGVPQGILIAEIKNWTGHIMMAPRSKLADTLKRPEMARTGIYFLTGQDMEGGNQPLLYIGESDNVGTRLTQHNKDSNKDFWEKACIVTSKDQNLTKTHVRYLESRLINIAREAGIAKVVNSTAPIYESLPESDIADMEYFINQIRLVMPVLGLDCLREKPPIIKRGGIVINSGDTPNTAPSPVFELNSKKLELHATAQEIDGEFIVLAGSECRTEWGGSNHASYRSLYSSLYAQEKIKVNGDSKKGIFQEDVAFSSPSAASAIVCGRASNGRVEWKIKGTSKTYADWQNEQIEHIDRPYQADVAISSVQL